jgi:hypothetical protein
MYQKSWTQKLLENLTPKGLNVRGGIWAVSLDLKLFLDFLKLFVNIRHAISFAWIQFSYFLDLRIKSYGCLKVLGEVWAGQALAQANEVELTKVPKSGGRRRKKGGGNKEKRGTHVRLVDNRRSPAARSPLSGTDYGWAPFSKKNWLKNYFFWGFFGDGPGIWKNGCTVLQFSKPCPYTWECEIFHSWRF